MVMEASILAAGVGVDAPPGGVGEVTGVAEASLRAGGDGCSGIDVVVREVSGKLELGVD